MKKEINKILLITVRADYGGGPRHVDVLVENIEKNIYIACPKDKPYFQKWKGATNVSDICVLPHRKFTPGAFYKLLKFCKRNKITIIHSHGKGAGYYSRLLRIFLPSAKIIHTYHGVGGFFLGGIKSKLSLWLEKKFAGLTDLAINVSNNEQSKSIELNLLPSSGSVVIYNGIQALSLNGETMSHVPIDSKKFIITTISRFDYPKNMSACLDVAVKLSKNKNITFLWVGDGENKALLEQKAYDLGLSNIIFTGFRSDVDYLLSKTDLYLSTSRWEGLPIALIEATSLGIPIVASDVVGNNEVVENGENGFLFPQKDIDAACNSILILYHNKELYKRMSIAAINRYNDYFTSEKMIKSLDNIYNNI